MWRRKKNWKFVLSTTCVSLALSRSLTSFFLVRLHMAKAHIKLSSFFHMFFILLYGIFILSYLHCSSVSYSFDFVFNFILHSLSKYLLFIRLHIHLLFQTNARWEISYFFLFQTSIDPIVVVNSILFWENRDRKKTILSQIK